MTPQGHLDILDLPLPADAAAKPRQAGCASFEELTPQQFGQRPELVVLLLHAPHGEHEFGAFRAVVPLPNSRVAAHYVAELPLDQPLGLVCPDGEASARLAIRLARQGRLVVHLAGGLAEWCRLKDCCF
jgi:rhodanese-related sulfurtransferase